MADEPQTPSTEAPPAMPDPPEPDKTVPYDRFQQVNQQAKEAKEAQKKLEDRLAELEDKDKSEVERHRAALEREQKERERLATELQQREQRLVSLERGGWVRDAAAEAKFIDPADALGRVDLSEIESKADAKREVKKIAEEAKHLVRQESGRPEIGRVVQAGQPTDPSNPADTEAQQREEGEKFVQELRDALARGSTSIPGLLDR